MRRLFLRETPLLAARTSAAITRLRWPLAVAVVFVHSFGRPARVAWEGHSLSALTAMDAYNLVRVCCSHLLAGVAVPAFFFVSGMLFFRGIRSFTPAVYASKLRRRVKSLLVPYLLWNALTVLLRWWQNSPRPTSFSAATESLSRWYEHKGGWTVFLSSHPIGRDGTGWLGQPTWHLAAPIDVPLWFVRELFFMALLSPVVWWLLRHLRAWTLLPLFAAYALNLWPPLHILSATAVFFFTAGAWFSVEGRSFAAFVRRLRLPLAVSAGVLGAALLFAPAVDVALPPPVSPFFVVAAVGTAFCLALPPKSGREWRGHRFLSRTSFFLYAAHTVLLLPAIDRYVRDLLPGDAPATLLGRYFLVPALTVAACTAIYVLLRTLCPALLGLFTGGREK